tara:strand:+ start:1302 stop:2009 length:708 start_codon:yes stop_codon:yes gene_type:complete
LPTKINNLSIRTILYFMDRTTRAMNREDFVYELDHIFEQFDMDSIAKKARKSKYRRVFKEEAVPGMNAGVMDGLEKSSEEVKHPVDWVIKDYDVDSREEDREWFMHTSTWSVAEALTETPDETDRVVEHFSKLLGLSADILQPRFLLQRRGEELRYHTDGVVNCGINYLLQGGETPVVFKEYKEPIKYRCAVFNTQALHMVPPLPPMGKNRLLFKLKVPRTGPTYHEVVEIIKNT